MNKFLPAVLIASLALFMTANAEAAKLKQSPAVKELLAGDAEVAIPMLIEEAEQGDALANAYVASVYRDGWGAPIDFIAAREHARIAAEGGVAAAWLMLSLDFKEELGGSRFKEAKKAAGKLAKKGDAFSAFYFARASEDDLGAGAIFNSLVLEPVAAGATGEQYDPNKPIRGDNYLSEKSKKYYMKAADSGYAPSAQMIAVLHSTGRGFENDNAAMMSRMEQAAAQDLAGAQYYLGTVYVTGRGVQADIERGLPLLREAVEKNHAAAQNVLGVMYRDGYGVAIDRMLALALFEKGKSAGNQDAAKNYGELATILAREEADRKEVEDRLARINTLKESHPKAVALAEQGAQNWLNNGGHNFCTKYGIRTGQQLLWAASAPPPSIAASDVGGKAKYAACLIGMSASVSHAIMSLDVDRAKRDGLLPMSKADGAQTKSACDGFYSLSDSGKYSTTMTIEAIVERYSDCAPAVIEQLVPLAPYSYVQVAKN